MNKSELTFSAVSVPLDYFAVFLAGLAAYGIRFGSILSDIRPVIYALPFKEFSGISALAGLGWIIVFALSGMYAIKTTRGLMDEFSRIFLACSTAVLIIIIFIFFQRELFSSRFIIISGWVLTILFVSIERFVIRFIQRKLLKKGIGAHRVVIIGTGASKNKIVNEITENPALGYKITGQMDIANEQDIERLGDSLKNDSTDEIIQADPAMAKELTLKIIELCNEYHIIFKYAANMFETASANIDISPLAGIPIIEIKRTPLDGWGKIFKRIFDLVFSFIALIFLSPFFIIIGIIIKLDSKGPVFYGSQRVGIKGQTFTLYKFRSMILNAHSLKKDLERFNERSDGPLFKMKNDPRITRVGKFIRKTSIDELPQFINALIGNISLVGPRPHEPEEVSCYQKHHKKLLALKPGMSGMAQISGRSDLSFEEEVLLDMYYIENWSLILDIQILFKTPGALFDRTAA